MTKLPAPMSNVLSRGGVLRVVAAVAVAAGAWAAAPVEGQVGEPPTFTDIAEDAGIDFRHTFGADRLENILMTTGSGVALFDYDGDGWLDAFFVNGTAMTSP